MKISDIRVRLVSDENDRLKAVCSITFDGEFVVRDVKVVEGTHGLFVAMPSRKLSAPCPKCRTQNHLRAGYCNHCGEKLPPSRIPADADGREKTHRDIAHPITASLRQLMQGEVFDAYRAECEQYDDTDGADSAADTAVDTSERKPSEYDAMIADLKGGAGDSRRRDENAGAGDGGMERGRRRQRGRRTRKPDVQERSTEDKQREEVAPASSDSGFQPFEPVGPAASEQLVGEESTVGAMTSAVPENETLTEERTAAPAREPEREREPRPAVADKVGLSDSAVKPTTSDEDSGDDAAFGAGIL